MKKSRLIKIVQEEIQKQLVEYGSEMLYYSAPGGTEQLQNRGSAPRIQRFEDPEKWRIVAMQLGATIQDRGDDWIAVLPNQDKLGTFSKMNQIGTLTL